MRKEIRVTMLYEGTSMRIEQTVTSAIWPVDIAAWAISVVEAGTIDPKNQPLR